MRIDSIQVAIVFKRQDDILYLLGQEIVSFQKRFQSQKQLTNLPESSPPEIPRLAILAPNFVVNISLNRIDIIATIPPNVSTDYKMSLNYMYKIVEDVQDILINGKIEYQWMGIVVNTEFTRKSITNNPLVAVEPVYDAILNVNRNKRSLASFNLQFGFSEAPFFINYFVGGYEKANLIFNNPIAPGTVIDISKGKKEIFDTGISINVDVNNRLQATEKNMERDFTSLIRKCEALLETVIIDLGLQSVLGS